MDGSGLLAPLGVRLPVLAAPMAGGASTAAAVIAAARAGSIGFVPAGYRSAEQFAQQLAEARAGGSLLGANLFAPPAIPVDPEAYARYRSSLAPEAAELGVELPPVPREDDDDWAAKLSVLREDPVPVVSFTFGLPDARTVAALRAGGTVVLQTVTTAAEARAAAERGVDGLVVQGHLAGGHSGTLTPERPPAAVPLPELVRSVIGATGLPVVAAGGIAEGAQLAAVLAAGAEAAAVGTALLRASESGASATHRAALADPAFTETAITRAFTGRPARGLRNGFMDRHRDAPLGYPALHHLTAPLRRAAVAGGDAGRLHLWAGAGFREAKELPVAEILSSIADG